MAKNIGIEALKETTITAKVVGDTDLILHKKTRSFEREELFKQTHPKGTTIPENMDQKKTYNMWEKLITSITWRDPIVFHDDDYSLYSQEEWEDYMQNNAPCILQNAIKGAMYEAFVTFFKESTGKNGTDIKRAISFNRRVYPIKFDSVGWDLKLVPNTGIAKTNVKCEQNVFSGWSFDLSLTFPTHVIPEKTVIEMLMATGKYIGLGTQHGNGFGRFHIEDVRIS